MICMAGFVGPESCFGAKIQHNKVIIIILYVRTDFIAYKIHKSKQ